ncbi:MAG: glycosyl hydrolase [Planctomycetes bacterium]|nr:glycosyl hydrolase [Planctomycetota bacterium]
MTDRLLLGTRKGLLTFRHRGRSWRLAKIDFPGAPVYNTLVDPRDRSLWALVCHGHWGSHLKRSRDGGKTFEAVPMATYPKGAGVSVRSIWRLAPGGVSELGTYYLGTDPGGMFVTRDGGETWALVESLWEMRQRDQWTGGGVDQPMVHAILVSPSDPARLLVAVSCAGVIESADGGATWGYRNRGVACDFLPKGHRKDHGHDPHALARAPSNPLVLWQQNHCGVYVSHDGAKSWKRVARGQEGVHDFGFPIAVDERDAGVAWTVPMESDANRVCPGGALVVQRTTDYGRSWAVLRRGLPRRAAFDMCLRHALDVSEGRVVFGTSTGNLYFSRNRGDSFETLGNNLPFIMSARFG